MSLFSVLILLISPFLHFSLGLGVFSLITRILKKFDFDISEKIEINAISVIGCYVFGLLLYLTLVFTLASFHFPLIQSSLISYLPAIFFLKNLKEIKKLKLKPSFNFLIWFTLHIFLGCSLFSAVDKINTPWINNFGDLTWHLGMIISFVTENSFPPQNHLFAGERLSYAFFVNLWSASLWIYSHKISFLSTIFTYQWLLIWSAVYFVLNGNRFSLLPWTILLAGGTFRFARNCLFNFFLNEANNKSICSYTLDVGGDPWSPFLTTVWVTQRSALFGLLVFSTAISLFLNSQQIKNQKQSIVLLTLSGLVLSLSLLVHTHFFLVAVLFCSLILFFDLIIFRNKDKKINLFIFLLALLPSIGFLPWIINKRNIISFVGGWMQKQTFKNLGLLSALENSFYLWQRNAWPWLLSILLICYLNKLRKEFLALVILLILGNMFQIAIWEWDQIKIFIMIYLISIILWSINENKKTYYIHSVALLFLIIPGICDFVFNFLPIRNHEVYSVRDLEKAKIIKMHTPTDAIIAAAPNHNSLITLTGRKLFFGYVGTLNSQGINYQEREKINVDLNKLTNCKEQNLSAICPNYLLWTEKEQAFWKQQRPPSESIRNTTLPYLFAIN